MPLNVDNIVSTTISKSYGVAVNNKRRLPSLPSLSSDCGTPEYKKGQTLLVRTFGGSMRRVPYLVRWQRSFVLAYCMVFITLN